MEARRASEGGPSLAGASGSHGVYPPVLTQLPADAGAGAVPHEVDEVRALSAVQILNRVVQACLGVPPRPARQLVVKPIRPAQFLC
jgi:hypothetical protein